VHYIEWVIKSGFVTNLDRYKLSAAVGVVVAVVFRTSQWGRGRGLRCVSPFCLFFSVSYWNGTMFLRLVFSGLLVGSLRAVVGGVALLSLFVV